MTRTCDCCKLSVDAVNADGVCFACGMFNTFATMIQEATGLSDDEALDLAGDLQDHALSALIERLQMPGQEHPLVAELLQSMERSERPN